MVILVDNEKKTLEYSLKIKFFKMFVKSCVVLAIKLIVDLLTLLTLISKYDRLQKWKVFKFKFNTVEGFWLTIDKQSIKCRTLTLSIGWHDISEIMISNDSWLQNIGWNISDQKGVQHEFHHRPHDMNLGTCNFSHPLFQFRFEDTFYISLGKNEKCFHN